MGSKASNIDCILGMSEYPDKYFELAIVDPPYGIGWDNHRIIVKPDRPNSAFYKQKYPTKNWDNAIPNKQYFTGLKRVSKNQIIWGANYFKDEPFKQPRISEYKKFIKQNPKGWIIWNKLNGEGSTFSDCELAETTLDIETKIFDCSPYHALKGGLNRIHPTEKPIKLYKYLLSEFATCKHCHNTGTIWECLGEKWMGSQEADCEWCDITEQGKPKILDTHLGSGSSRIACYDYGFDFTGFELDKDYFDAQEKRFNNHISQTNMFKVA